MTTQKLKINGMHCKSCAMLITDVLEYININSEFQDNILNIKYDKTKTDIKTIIKLIEKENFKVEVL